MIQCAKRGMSVDEIVGAAQILPRLEKIHTLRWTPRKAVMRRNSAQAILHRNFGSICADFFCDFCQNFNLYNVFEHIYLLSYAKNTKRGDYKT